MRQMIRKTIADGVRLTIVPTTKFKTSVMSISYIMPLGGPETSQFAVLPRVLRRGTAQYPDSRSLGGALDGLYGARIEPSVRKRGESLIIGHLCDVIDETYVKDSKGLTAQTAAMLASFWKTPWLGEDGLFCPDYTATERENLADQILAIKNNPRVYAPRRMYEIMCENELFGCNEFGSAEGARTVTPRNLFKAYEKVQAEACIELFYCGALPVQEVEAAFAAAIVRQGGSFSMPQTKVISKCADEVRTVTEEMDVGQGKLSMGFRTGITGGDELYPALMVFNAAFGGATSSKLFVNVREKLSLCYYASSMIEKQKGVMAVNSGIENEKFDVTREEILKQLRAVQNGGLSKDEMNAARLTVETSVRQIADSPVNIEAFWLGQSVSGLDWDTDDLLAKLGAVTRDDVIAAANHVGLDTVYFLKGVAK